MSTNNELAIKEDTFQCNGQQYNIIVTLVDWDYHIHVLATESRDQKKELRHITVTEKNSDVVLELRQIMVDWIIDGIKKDVCSERASTNA